MQILAEVATRNLKHHFRSHVAVMLGVAVGAAVLCGALFVGDSLRGSLKERADRQAAGVTAALFGDKLLNDGLAAKLSDTVPALILQGTAGVESDAGFVSDRVTIIGLTDDGFFRFGATSVPDADQAWIGEAAALKLMPGPGGEVANYRTWPKAIQFTAQQFSSVPRGSLLGKRAADDLTAGFSFGIKGVSQGLRLDKFSLMPGASEPKNVFVRLSDLQRKVNQPGKVNAMLSFGGTADSLNTALNESFSSTDAGLRVQVAPARGAYVSVESEQLIVPNAVVEATQAAAKALNAAAEPTTVYLANWIRSDDVHRIPYSVIAALNTEALAPLGPFGPLKDDEIILADWPESPLKDVPVGSQVVIDYIAPEIEKGERELSEQFRLAGRVPLAGAANDPNLTPRFPGITDANTIRDWKKPFETFDISRIQPNDINELFWNKYKATPKAYITRAAGAKLFASRFGVTTSVRVAPPAGMTPKQLETELTAKLRSELTPDKLGIQFDDTAALREKASKGGTDFGMLFLGFSFFLIVAALVLVGLLVRLSVERRARELGTLLAVGYSPAQVRNVILTEISCIAMAGALLGLVVALLYTRGLIALLGSLWPDASVQSFLRPHYSRGNALSGGFAAFELSVLTSWLAVRRLVKQPIPQLMRGRTETPLAEAATKKRTMLWRIGMVAAVLLGLGSIGFGTTQANPDFQALGFFNGGFLLFAAGVIVVSLHLRSMRTRGDTLARLGRRNAGRFPGRSVLTVFLIGSATFLLIAVESFRRKPATNFGELSGGSGGFNLLAEADVPLFHPFDVEPGRGDFLDLLEKEWQKQRDKRSNAEKRDEANALLGTIETLMPLRRRAGDDASCLNLYQAGKPRLLGVPKAMIDRGGFVFAQTEATTPEEKTNPWLLLGKVREDGAIPVFGEMNSVMYMLKKAVGETIELPDELGVMQKFRIVGTLQDCPFQSELLLADTHFHKLYPHDEGYAVFLIRSRGDEHALSSLLETGLRSHGLLVTPTRDRVAEFQKVVSTYLTTFQLLGGLGLFIGVLGLAAVVARGVLERVGEFSLLRAVGYSAAEVRTIVLAENLYLLVLGIGLGVVTAMVSVLPHVLSTGQLPWQGVLLLVGLVTVVGAAVVWLATGRVQRIAILDGLRSD